MQCRSSLIASSLRSFQTPVVPTYIIYYILNKVTTVYSVCYLFYLLGMVYKFMEFVAHSAMQKKKSKKI